MNLAMADASGLARAFAEFYRSGSRELLESYSAACLRRTWRAQHFASWMTSMLHRCEGDCGFEYRRQLAELDGVVGSRAGAAFLAENYAG